MLAPFPYRGGKTFLSKTIIPQIPPHRLYAEPFFGSGQIFFRKVPSRLEVINDRYAELVTFFRVCQHHHEELLRCLRFSVVSRRQYADLLRTPPESLTDIFRACRFLYLQKLGFNGRVCGQSYIHRTVSLPTFRFDQLPELICATHRRLNGVQIECLGYEEILRRFDGPDTFFYLDPPYYGIQLYKFNFQPEDFLVLAKLLASLHGRFLLSLNDIPEIRDIFSAFYLQQVKNFSATKKAEDKRTMELLISNYKPVPVR